MNKEEKEIEFLVKQIRTQLHKLESAFFEVYVLPGEFDFEPPPPGVSHIDYEEEDKKTWLFYGTRKLYYKICLFLEYKKVPRYYQMFTERFGKIIDNETEVRKDRGPLYMDDEPSMIIHDEFREFLSAFREFDYEAPKDFEVNKLKLILENTTSIIARTKTKISNEASIYKPVKWITEIVYPSTRSLKKARFIHKFKTYNPDILVPELSTAVEYKFIRSGHNIEDYLDEIKTDADNYVGDPIYKFFFAVVYFENKADLIPQAFKEAVMEKQFPNNWSIMAM
ncbi:PD-(D/E)XK nuclease domain-containing protein [Pontimicrobium sp. MEBiC06410]